MQKKNVFDIGSSRTDTQEEIKETIFKGSSTRIEHIISTGQTSKAGFWYDQPESEWVLLLSGEAEITFFDKSVIRMSAGDHLLIPAYIKHKVTYTSKEPPAIWLAVYIEEENHDK